MGRPWSTPEQILAHPDDPLSALMSYVVIRNGIGVLGLIFPAVLLVGGGLDHVQASLSAYYHFSPSSPAQYGAGTMRDVFVGMLCAIGAFLLFYRGHSLQEDLALNVAGISVVLIALVPMDWPVATAGTAAGMIHAGFATLFFLMISYVCIFRARDTLCIVAEPKVRRTFARIYLTLGMLMLAIPSAVAGVDLASPDWDRGYATLIIEIVGVISFACFWLIKSFEIRTSLQPKGTTAGSPISKSRSFCLPDDRT